MQLASLYDSIVALGADLWAVAPQDGVTNQALRQRRDLPFPILADPEIGVIRQWGLFNAADPRQRLIPYPAAYIVTAAGRVHWRYVGMDTRDRPVSGQLVAILREVVTG